MLIPFPLIDPSIVDAFYHSAEGAVTNADGAESTEGATSGSTEGATFGSTAGAAALELLRRQQRADSIARKGKNKLVEQDGKFDRFRRPWVMLEKHCAIELTELTKDGAPRN